MVSRLPTFRFRDPGSFEKMKKNIILIVLVLILSILTGFIYAEDKVFSVAPWNGYKAAVSLTYDDGDPIHLDLAIPEMQKRGIRGTFFLIADKIQRMADWEKAAEEGMEIGNHSSNHKHAYELSDEDDVKYEVDNAEKFLRKQFNQPVVTFAYPFVEITEPLRARVEKNCIIARGGGSGYACYTQVMKPDWYDIKSNATMTPHNFDIYKNWIDMAIDAGAWTVFMIHAIEGSDWWQPVPKDTFIKTLDYIKEKNGEVWAAPFGEIGAYWKAQKALEAATIDKKGEIYNVTWKKPPLFSQGVVLKIKLDVEGNTLTQAGKIIEPVSPGIYQIFFDECEFIIKKAK